MAPRTAPPPAPDAGLVPAPLRTASRRPARVARRLIGASIDLGGLAILLTQAWRMG